MTEVVAATSRDRAYAYLLDEVLANPASQGTFLNEQQIAQRVGVSRTPVREAMLLLAAHGLVEMVPKRGTYVPRLTGRQIGELMEMRGVLERYAAEATLAAGTAPVVRMSEVLDHQRELLAPQDHESFRRFIALDRDFHQALVDAVGNELICEAYTNLRTRQLVVGVEALYRSSTRRSEVCAEHAAILTALVAGDRARARSAIDEHLRITHGLLQRG